MEESSDEHNAEDPKRPSEKRIKLCYHISFDNSHAYLFFGR